MEYDDSYVVMFLGENPSMDNTKTGQPLNSARNVGYIKVRKDLGKILSNGPLEKGGYYTF